MQQVVIVVVWEVSLLRQSNHGGSDSLIHKQTGALEIAVADGLFRLSYPQQEVAGFVAYNLHSEPTFHLIPAYKVA